MEWLLEGGCFTCPEKDVDVLQFDHTRGERGTTRIRVVDNVGTIKHGNMGGSWRGMKDFAASNSWPNLYKELLKCDVVCANCHARRTASRRRYEKQLRKFIRAAKGID